MFKDALYEIWILLRIVVLLPWLVAVAIAYAFSDEEVDEDEL